MQLRQKVSTSLFQKFFGHVTKKGRVQGVLKISFRTGAIAKETRGGKRKSSLSRREKKQLKSSYSHSNFWKPITAEAKKDRQRARFNNKKITNMDQGTRLCCHIIVFQKCLNLTLYWVQISSSGPRSGYARQHREPPHCTHKLQPLVVSFMKPLSTYYSAEVKKWPKHHSGRMVTLYQVADLLGNA